VPERAKAQHAELPLDGDRIFCGTCHNPHEKGVIQRRDASAGAGEEHFLRLNGGYHLCVTCHKDKELKQARGTLRVSEGLPGLPQELISSHKPVTENKCKSCHAITAENREQPRALSLCFRTDCHKTEMLNQEFVHEMTVGENCYLCHSSHSSTYEKLLRLDKGKLCWSCHPLMRDSTGRLTAGIDQRDGVAGRIEDKDAPLPVAAQKEIKIGAFEKSSKEHAVFAEFLLTTPVPRGYECAFCHSPYHKKEIGSLSMDACARCHTFVRDILASKSKAPMNIHDTFQEKGCTSCHDPHAAPYEHVLREPVETYLPRKAKVPQISSHQ
jgi:predicted CXXCH cytochrome family protein